MADQDVQKQTIEFVPYFRIICSICKTKEAYDHCSDCNNDLCKDCGKSYAFFCDKHKKQVARWRCGHCTEVKKCPDCNNESYSKYLCEK